MPPPQCPECGRFLSHDFVVRLSDEPAACPRCGSVLRPEQFDLDDVVPAPPPVEDVPAATPAESGAPRTDEPPEPVRSVRPPDLPADTVRAAGEPRDVLAEWDRGPGPIPAAGPDDDLVVTAGMIVIAGVAGGLAGALLAGRHRTVGAVLGTLAGASLAAAGSRLFDEPTR